MRYFTGQMSLVLRRVLEITATTALTCVLALLLVIPGMRRKAQQQMLQLDPLVARSIEGYLDPRPVPEAPGPDQPPDAAPLGSGLWRDDFNDMWQWRGPRPEVQGGQLHIISQPDFWPVYYHARPWLVDPADIEVRVRCQGSTFEMGVAEAHGTPWHELSGRLNCARVRDGLLVYLNHSDSPHMAGMDCLAGDMLLFQTQGPVPRRRLDEFSLMRLELREQYVALMMVLLWRARTRTGVQKSDAYILRAIMDIPR